MSQTSLVYGWFRLREQFPKLKKKTIWANSEGWLFGLDTTGRFSKVHPFASPNVRVASFSSLFLKTFSIPLHRSKICVIYIKYSPNGCEFFKGDEGSRFLEVWKVNLEKLESGHTKSFAQSNPFMVLLHHHHHHQQQQQQQQPQPQPPNTLIDIYAKEHSSMMPKLPGSRPSFGRWKCSLGVLRCRGGH